MHKIPVTVITGFLGAGKTTLIRHLLQNNQGRRLAVIVNEFGEVGIDGDLLRACQVCDEDEANSSTIVELTNGCLCCTVQEEFLPTMQTLLQQRDRIDGIVIETSGLALPKPLVQAFRWPEIRTGATVDGVITVVDCAAIATGNLVGDLDALEAQRQADDSLDHETPIEELFEDQLACADLVLLTKGDCVEPTRQERVQNWLRQQLPTGVKVLPCHGGQISPELLLGFNAAVEDHLESRPSHHDQGEDHEHDQTINAIQILVDQPFVVNDLLAKLQELVATYEIYRIKGFVAVPDKPLRLVVHGVGSRLDSFYDRPWQPQEPRQTKLILIGRELPESAISSAILASPLAKLRNPKVMAI
jgi:cobalamin biosynthesis protein CobW